MSESTSDWPRDIYEALRAAAVRQVSYVPDAGHTRLIEACRADPAMAAVPLTTEEEGVALLAGAWLGGQRGALLMQSSGVGNCANMLALIQTCRFPLLVLVTMRGQEGEQNPWQLPMGKATAGLLDLCGVTVRTIDRAEEAGPTVATAARAAFEESTAQAVLISQQLIGVKIFSE